VAILWNLWHGCFKISEGCAYCYMYRADERYGRDSKNVHKTQSFTLPIQKNRKGDYKVPAKTLVWTCFTSDFFIKETDEWREEAWQMIKMRNDLHFYMVTKRVERIVECLPPDWGEGYENVTIACTVENQKQADKRLPIYNQLPIKHKALICEPLLTSLDLSPYLNTQIELVSVGGESGDKVRPCHYDWVKAIREQCVKANVPSSFKQTGAYFVKDGKTYHIPRRLQQAQAKKANINYKP